MRCNECSRSFGNGNGKRVGSQITWYAHSIHAWKSLGHLTTIIILPAFAAHLHLALIEMKTILFQIYLNQSTFWARLRINRQFAVRICCLPSLIASPCLSDNWYELWYGIGKRELIAANCCFSLIHNRHKLRCIRTTETNSELHQINRNLNRHLIEWNI